MKKDQVRTCYDDKRLAYATAQQTTTLHRLSASFVGLSITGTMKAATAKHLYLINRHGEITSKCTAISDLYLDKMPVPVEKAPYNFPKLFKRM